MDSLGQIAEPGRRERLRIWQPAVIIALLMGLGIFFAYLFIQDDLRLRAASREMDALAASRPNSKDLRSEKIQPKDIVQCGVNWGPVVTFEFALKPTELDGIRYKLERRFGWKHSFKIVRVGELEFHAVPGVMIGGRNYVSGVAY